MYQLTWELMDLTLGLEIMENLLTLTLGVLVSLLFLGCTDLLVLVQSAVEFHCLMEKGWSGDFLYLDLDLAYLA